MVDVVIGIDGSAVYNQGQNCSNKRSSLIFPTEKTQLDLNGNEKIISFQNLNY